MRFLDAAGSGIRQLPGKNDDLDASGRGWTAHNVIRNQQVSGSSPLAGSNRINNLQGFSGTGDCGRVGTMWANGPLRPARASTARQHRERPRPAPPLSLGGRCLPFDRVWPSPISSSAALQLYAVRRRTARSWYQSTIPTGSVDGSRAATGVGLAVPPAAPETLLTPHHHRSRGAATAARLLRPARQSEHSKSPPGASNSMPVPQAPQEGCV